MLTYTIAAIAALATHDIKLGAVDHASKAHTMSMWQKHSEKEATHAWDVKERALAAVDTTGTGGKQPAGALLQQPELSSSRLSIIKEITENAGKCHGASKELVSLFEAAEKKHYEAQKILQKVKDESAVLKLAREDAENAKTALLAAKQGLRAIVGRYSELSSTDDTDYDVAVVTTLLSNLQTNHKVMQDKQEASKDAEENMQQHLKANTELDAKYKEASAQAANLDKKALKRKDDAEPYCKKLHEAQETVNEIQSVVASVGGTKE